MKPLSIQTHVMPQPHDEQILVVKRELLFEGTAQQGFKREGLDTYLERIAAHKQFLPRSLMEQDPAYKQIIPYILFAHNDKLFLMQRSSGASESRLRDKFTLGIGGHVREEDMQSGATLFDWARREFHEEVVYGDSLSITPLGILNDDSNDVGKVHMGLVLLVRGDSDQISVRSELKFGFLASFAECEAHADRMETWSQLLFAGIKTAALF